MSEAARRGLPVVARLGTFTWRMAATVLAGQSILLFFGALAVRGQEVAAGRSGTVAGAVGLGLALAAVAAAGLMRGRAGLPLGWLVQVATWVSVAVVPAMAAVGLVFTGLWVFCLVKGPRVDAAMSARQVPVGGNPASSVVGDKEAATELGHGRRSSDPMVGRRGHDR